MIELQNIGKIYDSNGTKTEALKEVSLTIEDNEMVAIMGASGSGKSTLLNIIGAMDFATSGTYKYNDICVSNLKLKQLNTFRKDYVSFIFQNFALMSDYTVYENIELPLLAQRVPKKQRKGIVLDKLELLGIKELAKKYPGQISGGQKQKCAIARAMAADTQIILADEPTGALDSTNGNEIMKIFRQLHDMGKTVIIITHDNEVANKCDRIIRIKDGQIVE